MRILLIHTAVNSDSGEFQRTKKLACDFSRFDNNTFIELNLLKPYPLGRFLSAISNKHLLDAFPKILMPVLLPGSHFRIIRLIENILKIVLGLCVGYLVRPDVVIGETHNTWRVAYYAAKKINKAFLLVDIHGAIAEELQYVNPESRSNKALFNELNLIERQILEYSDAVLVQSELMIKYLKNKHQFLNSNVFTYQCGVDVNHFFYSEEHRAAIRQKLGIPLNSLVFVYVGGLHKWQLMDCILVIFKNYIEKIDSNAKLMIFNYDNLRKLFDIPISSEIPKKSLIIHKIMHEELNVFLSAADLAFLLRHDTSFNQVASPTKLGEYFACGIPVITFPGAKRWPWWSFDPSCFCILDEDDIEQSIKTLFQYWKFVSERRIEIRKKCRFLAEQFLSSRFDSMTIERIIIPRIKSAIDYEGSSNYK